jgi:hypothetical protein
MEGAQTEGKAFSLVYPQIGGFSRYASKDALLSGRTDINGVVACACLRAKYLAHAASETLRTMTNKGAG